MSLPSPFPSFRSQSRAGEQASCLSATSGCSTSVSESMSGCTASDIVVARQTRTLKTSCMQSPPIEVAPCYTWSLVRGDWEMKSAKRGMRYIAPRLHMNSISTPASHRDPSSTAQRSNRQQNKYREDSVPLCVSQGEQMRVFRSWDP